MDPFQGMGEPKLGAGWEAFADPERYMQYVLILAAATLSGALRLSAQGQWAATGLRLRGEATAAPGSERALDNLLNIIGRRQGARSVFAIG